MRSHTIAPAHAVTTHATPTTPNQVIRVIDTPIGPNGAHPSSRIGNTMRPAGTRITPSMITPASPANSRNRLPRPPSLTSRTGLSDQNIQVGINDSRKSGRRPYQSNAPALRMASRPDIVARYRKNHSTARQMREPMLNSGRRQALANMPATVIAIGTPHTRNPRRPMTVHVDLNPADVPKAERTTSLWLWSSPSCREKMTPTLALSEKPEK